MAAPELSVSMPPVPPARADHSRFVQRVRRRWGGWLSLLPPGAPDAAGIDALVQRLLDTGCDLPSALRVARHLVIERLAVLDVEGCAPLEVVTHTMSALAEASTTTRRS